MRIFWVAAAAACLFAAGRVQRMGLRRKMATRPSVSGILCNTPQQAEQFVSLRGKGAAARKGDAGRECRARDGHACGVAAVAYIRNQTVGTVKLKDRLVQIVRINVVAGFTGSGWERATADMIQYAVLEGAGESV